MHTLRAEIPAQSVYWKEKMFSKKEQLTFLLALFSLAAITNAYDYDPNDFATEVVSYIEGAGVYDLYDPCYGFYIDPNTALGGPTIETTGDMFIGLDVCMPVLPVYPAWRANELVTIGQGGELVVKFNHPVGNDENNLFGIDLIVFGNARLHLLNGGFWELDSDPNTVKVNSTAYLEPGIVSVSQDGSTWYTFDSNNGLLADTFAPTASYQWDDINSTWGERLDPTKPLDPNLSLSNLHAMTVVEVVETYNGSAGGTGFDIGNLGLEWIQYVRIQDDANTTGLPDIDAIADVAACGDWKNSFPHGDITKNCKVDLLDFAVLASQWQLQSEGLSADIEPEGGNDIVNFDDLYILTMNWLKCSWQCEE